MVGNLRPDLPDLLVLLFLLRGWEEVGRNGRNGRNDEEAGMVSKKEGNRHRQVLRGAAPQLFTARCTGREAQIVCMLWKKVYVRKGTVRRRAGLSFPCSVMSLVEAGRSFVELYRVFVTQLLSLKSPKI